MKIIMATGGSGGHVFPALATAKILKARGHEVVFAGTLGSTFSKIQSEGFRAYEVKGKGFSRKSWSDLMDFCKSVKRALTEARQIICEESAELVVGFGGYGAFPIVLKAAFLKVPTMIHEQNVIPGKANRLLSYLVTRVAVSFSSAKRFFPLGKTVLTGCPMRQKELIHDRNQLLKDFGLLADKKTLLVLGGSQGSHRINVEILKVLPTLNQPIQVIHLCGEKDYESLLVQYQKLGLPFSLHRFSDRMNEIYQIADLVISRAGAMTVTEIAAYGLPALFIPYPYAGGHQLANAQVLAQCGVSRILEEKNLTSERLTSELVTLLNQFKTRTEYLQAYEGVTFRDAEVRLADQIEQVKS